MDYQYTGIVIKKRDVGETDRIYTIFTRENGKVQALAKGVRKPHARLAGNLEPMTLVDVGISRTRGMGSITGAVVEQNFSRIKSDLEGIALAFSAAQILDRTVELEQPDENIFRLLHEYLVLIDLIGESDGKRELIRLGFIFKLMKGLGYGLEVGKCVGCGEALLPEAGNSFSAERGGIVCNRCVRFAQDSIPIRPNSIKIIRLFFRSSLSSLIKLSVSQAEIRELGLVERAFVRWNTR